MANIPGFAGKSKREIQDMDPVEFFSRENLLAVGMPEKQIFSRIETMVKRERKKRTYITMDFFLNAFPSSTLLRGSPLGDKSAAYMVKLIMEAGLAFKDDAGLLKKYGLE